MASESDGKRRYRKIVKRAVVIDRDAFIRFLKAFGFEATRDPNLFRREEARKTRQRAAGARYYETLDLEELLANAEMRRRLVADMSRRHPEIAKRLEQEMAKEPRPGRRVRE